MSASLLLSAADEDREALEPDDLPLVDARLLVDGVVNCATEGVLNCVRPLLLSVDEASTEEARVEGVLLAAVIILLLRV